ncbi:nitroreductase family protein [Paenarthrobacter nitroguajacolicus]|uniref:nitroreductase family protein n=1 Tax=Paenarthrobacter nitroguajacolicus TaxID=211146 RepID=UPI00248C8CFD|nr:nitroreductase family protein [Paenarthrobacter nitroguajacolicus]
MIEKGLTMRPRRATFAAEYIVETVDATIRLFSDIDAPLDEAEREWISSVLADYFNATAESDHDNIASARTAYQSFVQQQSSVPALGPHLHDLSTPAVKVDDLLALAQNRRSARWFRDETVGRDHVDRAVAIALESPTACNRQPYRFEIFDDRDAIKRVAEIPMGTAGYSDQLVGLVVVVGRLSAFFDERDRHLIYIDSSLATMSLVLGLEAQGIASCIINWPDIAERDAKIRKVINIDADERVVMMVAYGYPDNEALVPYSQKGSVDATRTYNSIRAQKVKRGNGR